MSDRLVSSLLFRRGRSVQRLRKTDHHHRDNHLHTLPPSPISLTSYQQQEAPPRLDAKKRLAKVISCLRFIHKGKRKDRNVDIDTTMNHATTVASQRFINDTLPSPPLTPQQQICNRNELQRASGTIAISYHATHNILNEMYS